MRLLIPVFFLAFIFCACQNNNKKTLPEYTGRAGEIIVVINKNHWDTTPGDLIRKHFEQQQLGVLQEEVIFKLINIPHTSFSGILQRQRTVLMVNINPTIKNSAAVARKSLWAEGQIVMEINATSEQEAAELIELNGDSFVDFVQNTEIERLQKSLAKTENNIVISQLKKDYQLSVSVPANYHVATTGENFVWLKSEEQKPKGGDYHQITRGIMIYFYPYTNQKMFEKSAITVIRDSITKQYIPGFMDGSYMQIENAYDPNFKEINLNGSYGIELRGLWKLHADFMGGPFISYTTVDQQRNRIVTVEGFLYCPKFDKREYLREMEAVLKTLSFEPLLKL